MANLRICFFFGLLVLEVYGQRFSTESQDQVAILNDDVTFSCGILSEDAEDSSPITWIFQSKATGAANLLALDNNILKWTDMVEIDSQSVGGARTRNLKLSRVTLDQEGEYVCTLTGDNEITQSSHLTVNIPPSISMVPDVEIVEVQHGDYLVLACTAQGKPEPTVTWGRVTPQTLLPSGDASIEAEELFLDDVGPYDSGIYECTASNGAGEPVSRTVDVRVQYAPNVTVHEEAIHTGPGDDISITCSFLASPEVEMAWYRNGEEVTNDQGLRNIVFGDTREEYKDSFTLRINGLQKDDLGTYECIGKNKLGEATGVIVLSAHPHSLVITSRKNTRYSDQYKLKWTLISFPEITQYDLQVEQHNDTASWLFENLTLPSEGSSSESPDGGRDRLVSYLLKDLEANTTYSVRLRAVNEFGNTDWEEFTFHTADEGNDAPPPTTLSPTTVPPPSETKPRDRVSTDDEGDFAVTKAEVDKTKPPPTKKGVTAASNQIVSSLVSIATAIFLAAILL